MKSEEFSIDVIPINDLKQFISGNDYDIPKTTKDIYDISLDIINSKDFFYIPDNIKDWIKAKDLNEIKRNIPIYKASEIITSSYESLIALSQQLDLLEINKDQILRVLLYLNRLDNDMSVFDNLPNDVIINIMKNLDCKSIMLMCKSSARIAKICNQDNTLINLLKERFTKIGYKVENFDLQMLEYMCFILNREYPTMTSYGNILYVLNNNRVFIVTFTENEDEEIIIKEAYDAYDVIQILYYDEKLLLLNKNGTIDYISLFNNDNNERINIININNIIYMLPESRLEVISANGIIYKFKIIKQQAFIIGKITGTKIINESIGTCNSLKLTINYKVYNNNKIIHNLNNIVDISSGDCHNLAVRSDGQVYAWGDNKFGQLGLDNEISMENPTIIPNLNNIVKVLASDGISLAIDNHGDVFKFGREFDTSDLVPYQLNEIKNAIELYQNRNYSDINNLKLFDIDDLEQIYNLDKTYSNYQFVRTTDNIYYVLIGNIVNVFELL